MVDLSPTDTLDSWFSHSNEPTISQSPTSNSEPTLPVTKVFSTLSNTDEQSSMKKRKQEPTSNDIQEKKKSKQTPAYMRRNIRHLFTNDKLQGDTLTALKAEQDRLKRLEEVSQHYPQFSAIYNQLTANNNIPASKEDECIVLEDDENDDERTNSISLPTNSNSTEIRTNDNDGSDSDVQYLDEDEGNYIDEKMTQKLRRLHLDDRINMPNDDGNILTNINHPSDDPDLFMSKHLCSILKPHQIGGIRFLYDNIVQSIQNFQSSPGLGCILAHSMGCGKTIQIITFLDILLRHTPARLILIVVPINTLQNWVNEFNRWSPIDDPTIDYQRPYQLYILNETSKKHQQRVDIVRNWSRTGGALIIGYEMFRLMTTRKSSQTSTTNKNIIHTGGIIDPSSPSVSSKADEEKTEDARSALLNPDLVICDEGHRIKNHQAGVAMALKSIKTQRRIVLTGYPLQNNLLEYWCMVDFVRPNYLGSKKEFCNMFERPILNGQCVDSTSEDRQLMRARAHVLHSLLEGFIQRRGHDVLQIDLPSKTEYVILLKLSSTQRQLYMKFLQSIGVLANPYDRTMNPLRAFALCCKIWNHADVLHKFIRNRQDGSDLDLDLDIDPNSNATNRSSSVSRTQTENTDGISTPTMSLTEKKDFDYDFANAIWNTYQPGQLSNGIKFQVALTIIDLSIRIGDKVLLFSQSLLSLDKFEEFLHLQQIPNSEEKWEKNVNYYRLDGATNSLERERLINAFNAPQSNIKLFLLSTRAGCLGINLIAANRVIVMDVSWNPCLDAQAVCRVYRYGQRKHCYIYRLIADFTMEKRIYDRQIAKQGMSDRVVDELQPQNQFTRNEVENLLHFAAEEEPAAPDLIEKIDELSDDPILSLTCKHYAQSITKIPFTHESLLLDQKECQMTSAEKRRAEKEYQHEKRMNAFTNRSRYSSPRTSSFHSRYLNDYIQRSYNSSPTLSSSSSSYHHSFSPMNNYSEQSIYRPILQKPEQSRGQGISIQPIVLRNPLQVQINALQREFIPAGTRIHMIKSARGSFIRTMDGKFFAIRQSTSTTNDLPKPISTIPSPPPPLPPPPLPQPPVPAPSVSSFLDEILLDSPSLPSNESFSSLMNDLNDEIDLLLDDADPPLPPSVPPPPPSLPLLPSSSSTTENFHSWLNDCLPSNDFFSDLFLDQSV